MAKGGGVNKIPINLHYTINPMRSRQHSPFWIFPNAMDIPAGSLFLRTCGPIRRTGKVSPPHRWKHHGDLFAFSNTRLERGDHVTIDRFSVSSTGYMRAAYISSWYTSREIFNDTYLFSRDTFARYDIFISFLNLQECEMNEKIQNYNLSH